jgi:hypothetical protein
MSFADPIDNGVFLAFHSTGQIRILVVYRLDVFRGFFNLLVLIL